MIVEDKPATVTPPWTSITLPKPKPPEPRPDPKPRTQQPQTQFTAPPSPRPPVVQDPPEAPPLPPYVPPAGTGTGPPRSEEHTSELQSLMRISYAVFCLKKNIPHKN